MLKVILVGEGISEDGFQKGPTIKIRSREPKALLMQQAVGVIAPELGTIGKMRLQTDRQQMQITGEEL